MEEIRSIQSEETPRETPQSETPYDELSNPDIGLGAQITSFAWELIKVVAVALFFVIIVKWYLVQPFCVKGESMHETFNNEDYILIDKLRYRLDDPERLDVIVFRYPFDTSQFFIKRIIGLPGEGIEIKDNRVIIYNIENPEGMVIDESQYVLPNQFTKNSPRTQVGENEYFVMGDNRPRSLDSRSWGILDREFISGKVFFTVLSQSKFCHLIGTETSEL